MSEIFVQKNQYGTYVSNQLMYTETINGVMYNAIAGGIFNFFLPLSFSQTPQGSKLECSVQGQLVRFEDYFRVPVTKNFFINFACDIAEILKFCKVNRINANNIEFQKDCIFVDTVSNKLKFIYWPLNNNQRSSSPEIFLSQLPSMIPTIATEDTSYLQEYANFFNGGTPFDVERFEMLLTNLRNTNNNVQPAVVQEQQIGGINDFDSQSAVSDGNAEEIIAKEDVKPAIESVEAVYEQPQLYVFCTSCGTKNSNSSKFCVHCGSQLVHLDEEDEENIPGNDISENNADNNIVDEAIVDDSVPAENGFYAEQNFDDTVVENPIAYAPIAENQIEENAVEENFVPQTYAQEQNVLPENKAEEKAEEPVVYPVLTRVNGDDKYVIVKPVYSIGKKKEICDMFIDNTYVSRHHADIIKQDDHYYIMDKGSLNKTYVDDTMIDPETPVEIFDGTKITIANEDFIFSLETID